MQLVPHRHSLIAQTAQILREGMQQGLWAGHLPGERSLCERLNISRPTLRAALAQLAREGWLEVAQGKARRILPPTGRHEVARRQVVQLLTPVRLHAVPPFVMFWLDELREHLGAAGQGFEVQVAPVCYTQRPFKALESLIRRAPASVWVLYQATAPMQRWFAERGLPCLVAGSCFPGVSLPFVDVDYRAACRHAASLLLAKGHQRVVFIARDRPLGGDVASEAGFLEAFRQDGQQKGEPLILRHDEMVANLCGKLERLFQDSFRRPTGLLVARSYHALTVVNHLLRMGLQIPNDVAVISRDDDAFLNYVVPSLARYRSDPALYARKILRLCRQLAAGNWPMREQVLIMPRFLKGESTG